MNKYILPQATKSIPCSYPCLLTFWTEIHAIKLITSYFTAALLRRLLLWKWNYNKTISQTWLKTSSFVRKKKKKKNIDKYETTKSMGSCILFSSLRCLAWEFHRKSFVMCRSCCSRFQSHSYVNASQTSLDFFLNGFSLRLRIIRIPLSIRLDEKRNKKRRSN